jgi:hypothetical protein
VCLENGVDLLLTLLLKGDQGRRPDARVPPKLVEVRPGKLLVMTLDGLDGLHEAGTLIPRGIAHGPRIGRTVIPCVNARPVLVAVLEVSGQLAKIGELA